MAQGLAHGWIGVACRHLFGRLVSTALFSAICGSCLGAPGQDQAYHVDLTARTVMQMPAPPAQRYQTRDGAELVYRFFAPAASSGPEGVVAILVHGSGGSSLNLTVLGEALARSGVPVFAPDIRGQGLSGRRGDIDYIGQLEDDFADFVAVVRRKYPAARLVLVGHSAGGGFALRIAGSSEGRQFSKFVLLAPVLGRLAPTNRPANGWASPHIARIVALRALNLAGVTRFNGATTVTFNLPPDAQSIGMTTSWSYRMMNNFGPSGQLQSFGRPRYLVDAEHAPAPIAVIVGSDDEQFFADKYAAAFAGSERQVSVELADGVNHMGVVSDPRAVSVIVDAVKRPEPFLSN
jgi:pimeloyl-ACP methyl ester carboxylesterase